MSEELSLFSSILELFLNSLEFLAVATSVFTFFFLMFSKFPRALKKILEPCGMDFSARIKVLILCRQSNRKKRAFIEYAIIKTRGETVISSKWKRIINEFKGFYREEEEMVYSLHNVTSLLHEHFSETCERYFEVFGEDAYISKFGIEDSRIPWIIKINIEDAYITPTCLITGLLSKYEENWRELINRYVSTAFITGEDSEAQDVMANELYYTFAWLLWGPSYELNFKNHWAGLCQISFGDESNSIPAVAGAAEGVASFLQKRFIENAGTRYGLLTSVKLGIYQNRNYYQELRKEINADNGYFYNKVENGELSFAAEIETCKEQTGYRAEKYYCTAYVWLMFELEEEGSFRPEKSVAFFEHANLTDEATYSFLIETLIDKSLKHFDNVFQNPGLKDRKYRFVCAMNDRITERFLERVAERMEKKKDYKERMLLTPRYLTTEVFTAFDDYFSNHKALNYEEVDISKKETIVDLGIFYTDVFMECFPDEDERESFDHLLYYLKQARELNKQEKMYRYHILLAKDEENKIIGGAVFDYFKESNCGMIEYIAIKKDCQSIGSGTMLYHKVQEMLSVDSYVLREEALLSGIFCEMDSPEYHKDGLRKYLNFWNKNNFKRIDMQYIQPSLSASQQAVEGLWLSASMLENSDASIDRGLVLSVIRDYMKYSMQIRDPKQNETYLEMERSTEGQEKLGLRNILDDTK